MKINKQQLNQKGEVEAILVAIVLVVIVVVGYWYVITQRDVVPPETIPMVTTTPEIQELTSTIDTTHWIESSYGNSRLFSFKYPPDWTETLTSGGYYYKPNNDPDYTLYISDPTLNGESVEGLITLVTNNTSQTVLSKTEWDNNGHHIGVLQIRSSDDLALTTFVYVSETPRTLDSRSTEVLHGVLSFMGVYTNTEVNKDPYVEVLESIARTMRFDR